MPREGLCTEHVASQLQHDVSPEILMTQTFKFTLLLNLIILGGCTNPVNMHTAQRYHNEGLVAEQRGNYKLAHQNYHRAYVNTEIGHAKPRVKALAMYNLGRMKGYLCYKIEAEKLLKKSIEIERKETNGTGDWYLGRLMEMGAI